MYQLEMDRKEDCGYWICVYRESPTNMIPVVTAQNTVGLFGKRARTITAQLAMPTKEKMTIRSLALLTA